MQERHGQQVIGREPAIRDQSGRTGRDDPFAHQFQIIDPLPVALPEMDRGIELVAVEIERRQAGADMDHDLGVPGGEIEQARPQPAHPEGWQRGEVQAAAGAVGFDLEAGAGQVMQAVPDRFRIFGPRRCQGQPLALAPEHGRADLFFEHFQLPADGRVGEGQLIGGCGGRSQPLHRFERQQGADRGQEAARCDHVSFSPVFVCKIR